MSSVIANVHGDNKSLLRWQIFRGSWLLLYMATTSDFCDDRSQMYIATTSHFYDIQMSRVLLRTHTKHLLSRQEMTWCTWREQVTFMTFKFMTFKCLVFYTKHLLSRQEMTWWSRAKKSSVVATIDKKVLQRRKCTLRRQMTFWWHSKFSVRGRKSAPNPSSQR